MAKDNIHLDFYKDVRWQKKRLEILDRDNYTCQKCKTPPPDNTMLHIHHRHYLKGRMPWDYPSELLVTLCPSHHKEEEECREILKELVPALHFWGYFNTDIRNEVNNLISKRIPQTKTNG